MANLDLIRGRQVVVPLTNRTGGEVIAGDVVIVDAANDEAFKTTTTLPNLATVGIVQETIADLGVGRVLISGYAPLVNVDGPVTRGHYLQTAGTVKEATGSASRSASSAGQFLTAGENPSAVLWGSPGAEAGIAGPVGPAGPAGSGVTDHGALTGLVDNDHTQYILKSAMSLTGDMIYNSGVNNYATPAFATVSASSFISPTYPPTLLMDGNDATTWHPSAASGQYATFDLGTAREVVLWRIVMSTTPQEIPANWLLQWSPDGVVAYTTIDTVPGTTGGDKGYRAITPTTARFWRILQSGSVPWDAAVRTVELLGSGVVAATPSTAFGRSLLDDADAAAARTTLGISATNTPVTPFGTITSTNVQAALAEVLSEAGGAGLLAHGYASVAAHEGLSALAYGDLSTVGPAVTLAINTKVKVTLTAMMSAPAATGCYMSVVLSGANTLAAADANSLRKYIASASDVVLLSRVLYLSGLTPGSTVFSTKFRVDTANPGFWDTRSLLVECMD